MTITAPEPDPRANESAAVVDAVAHTDGGDRSPPRRGELVLLCAWERGDAGRPARRLRVAPPVQLELVSAREGPRPELLWASLPERTREAVLVLLARLICTGTIEEERSA